MAMEPDEPTEPSESSASDERRPSKNIWSWLQEKVREGLMPELPGPDQPRDIPISRQHGTHDPLDARHGPLTADDPRHFASEEEIAELSRRPIPPSEPLFEEPSSPKPPANSGVEDTNDR